MMHICVGNFGLDKGLWPIWHKVIILAKSDLQKKTPRETFQWNWNKKKSVFSFKKSVFFIWKSSLQNVSRFVPASIS